MVRCIWIFRGVYDDVSAIDIDSFSGQGSEVEEFKKAYKTCAAEINPEEYGDDYCKISTRYADCFNDNLKLLQ